MIRSMTGYGSAEREIEGRVLGAEIRSVNHRHLEVAMRLPRGLQNYESKLRGTVQESLVRGKVNLTVAWKGDHDGSELSWDADLAARYYGVLMEMRERFDFREPVTLGHLVGHPEVLRWDEPALDPDRLWEAVSGVVGEALADLVTMREKEGAALAQELTARIASLRASLAAVEARSPERAREAKDKLHARVTELLEGEAKVEEERLLTEAAFQAERMDCTEECVRLESHFVQFEELMAGETAAGRKLNFLLQEMNREANTIGSKGNDVAVAREVITLKEDIEIIREQVANIE